MGASKVHPHALVDQSMSLLALHLILRSVGDLRLSQVLSHANAGAPLCQQCWRWGHTIRGCKACQLRCSHCSGPHELESHRHACGLCKGNLKAKPPVPPTAADQPCPHLARCSNCRERHPATDCKCLFWCHRYDPQWINAKYAEVRVHRAHGRTISNNQNIA